MDKTRPPGDDQARTQADVAQLADRDMSGWLIDDYKLLRRLGLGGMGQVYLAQQISLNRQVALKLLRPDLAASATAEQSLARFKAEATAIARATHANIVQIYAVGQAGRINFMALEYVEGRNLREYVEKKKPIDADAGLKIMLQVAAALQRAGELNIVHRDIKPENILISRAGEVKVADFGLVRCFDQPVGLTGSDTTLGTPLYMSPEQVGSGRAADHRSDIYSFGVTCFYMFAGRTPFRGETPLEVAYQHVHKEPEPLSALRPDLPAALCAIIHKMLAKVPEARYQTARELLRELTRLSDKLRSDNTATDADPADLSPLDIPDAPATSGSPGRRYQRYGLAAVGLAAVLIAALVIGWYRNRPDPVSVAAPNSDDAAAKALFSPKEREGELLKQVRENYKASGPVDPKLLAGLGAVVDLGLLYLDDHRLTDADAFFKELCPPLEKNCPGRLLSQLGKAMVLAFQDQPVESNRQFLAVVAEFDRLEKLQSAKPGSKKDNQAVKDEVEVYNALWRSPPEAPPLREMVARALYHNYRNDPKNFPAKLEPLRSPPRPVIKSGS